MKRLGIILTLIFCLVTSVFGADKSLKKVQEKGYFIVGLDDTFAPFGFRDENGELVGYDIDLAKEVAKRMGVEARFKPCEWDGILFELKSKKVDMVWNGMSITESRKKQAAFSKPYEEGRQIIFTLKGKRIDKVEELEGKIVGVQLGSTGDFAIQKSLIFSKIKEVKKYGTLIESIMDLEAGRIDAVVAAQTAGGYYNSKKQNLEMSSETVMQGDASGVAFRKEDNKLREAVDKALDDMKADGTFQNIYSKWFGK